MEDEWHQVNQAIMFLKPFTEYTHDISASTRSTIYNVYFIYNDIFDHIARHCPQVRNLPDAPMDNGPVGCIVSQQEGAAEVLFQYHTEGIYLQYRDNFRSF